MGRAPAAPHETIGPPVYIRKVSGNSVDLAKTEWLLTDGQGGFAMGTAAGIPTRRYHGWLVASTSPPVGRVVMLSSCVETLIENPGAADEKRYDLSSFFFPDAVHPAGHTSLTSFEAGTTVRWEYAVGGGDKPIRVTRELCLLRPEQRGGEAGAGGAAIVRYTVHSPGRRAELDVRPLLAMRDFHGLLDGRTCHDRFIVSTTPGVVGVEVAARYGTMPSMNLACDGARFVSGSQWWHDFEYPRDAERGQHHREDLFCPGSFLLKVDGGGQSARAELVAWTGQAEARPEIAFDDAARGQRERVEGLIERTLTRAGRSRSGAVDAESAAVGALTAAADAFVVRRATTGAGFSTSVIAGYPWFADWGRDTMITLPGLMLATGRFEEALHALETFALLCKDGLIPNCFDDATGKPEYNTVDASLWFIHAACQYAVQAKDGSVLKAAVGRACREIIESYRRGTKHKIKMDDDGLIAAGDATTQLTWMDARRDGVVFTPRFGKPVEVNALWFNALESLAGAMEKDQPKTAREYRSMSERAGASFVEKFWSPRSRSCCDCLIPENGSGKWRCLPETRPNQIYAASLPHSPLDTDQRAGVVECVRSKLLTPLGLKTLSPGDPGYIGRYRGSLFERDRAYHNGTVWPYLIGAYAEAVLRAGNFSPQACAEVRETLRPLVAELDSSAPGRLLGQIAEVYDGDERAEESRQPAGCPAQAWSASEVLRVMVMVGRAETGGWNG